MNEKEKRIEILTEFLHKLTFGMEQKHHHGLNLGINVFVINYVGWMKESTMRNISNFFNIKASTATRRMDKLVDLGLIRRETDEKDRRLISVKLTDKGKIIYNDIVNRMLNRFDTLEQEFNEEQLDNFFHIICYVNKLLVSKDVAQKSRRDLKLIEV